jgi:hypothetical protein
MSGIHKHRAVLTLSWHMEAWGDGQHVCVISFIQKTIDTVTVSGYSIWLNATQNWTSNGFLFSAVSNRWLNELLKFSMTVSVYIKSRRIKLKFPFIYPFRPWEHGTNRCHAQPMPLKNKKTCDVFVSLICNVIRLLWVSNTVISVCLDVARNPLPLNAIQPYIHLNPSFPIAIESIRSVSPLLSLPRRPPPGAAGHHRRVHLGAAADWDERATIFFSLSTQKPTLHLPAPSAAASDRQAAPPALGFEEPVFFSSLPPPAWSGERLLAFPIESVAGW